MPSTSARPFYSIGTTTPSPFELSVFEDITEYLEPEPNNPFLRPNTTQSIQTKFAVAHTPFDGDRGAQEARIVYTVWAIVIQIAKQIEVRDDRHRKLGLLLRDLNLLYTDVRPQSETGTLHIGNL